ncbi:hypothetical protein [Nostoc sp.]|uniref:hypothetical protein n=1 Tax=Nostoc sp. TaxID=1180 RepID=UPI002FFA2522
MKIFYFCDRSAPPINNFTLNLLTSPLPILKITLKTRVFPAHATAFCAELAFSQ